MEYSLTIRVIPGLVGELNVKPGEIDLGLLALRGLGPNLERVTGSGRMSRTARFTAVSPPAYPRSLISRHSRTAVRPEGRQAAHAESAAGAAEDHRSGGLRTATDIFADGLAVDTLIRAGARCDAAREVVRLELIDIAMVKCEGRVIKTMAACAHRMLAKRFRLMAITRSGRSRPCR
jgi:hypothetical protein